MVCQWWTPSFVRTDATCLISYFLLSNQLFVHTNISPLKFQLSNFFKTHWWRIWPKLLIHNPSQNIVCCLISRFKQEDPHQVSSSNRDKYARCVCHYGIWKSCIPLQQQKNQYLLVSESLLRQDFCTRILFLP